MRGSRLQAPGSRPSGVVRAFLVVLATFALSTTAYGAPAVSAAAPGLHVASALFTPTRSNEGIVWRAQWVLTPDSVAEIDGGATRLLRFALPLAGGETIEPALGLVPVLEEGHIVGVLVDRAALDGRTVRAAVQQRDSIGADAHVRLGAPVAAGTALQIIDGDLGTGTRFEIDPAGGLERRVGHVATPNVGHAAREEARRLTGYDSRLTGAALYVRGDDMKAANGVTATIVTPRGRGRHGALAIALAFAALVGGLFIAVRQLRHKADVERADALLAAELDALENDRV